MDWVHCSLTPSNLSHIKVEVKNNQRFVQGHKVVSGKYGPKVSSFVFKKIFISLTRLSFLAALGLCFCPWAFSSFSEQGLLIRRDA